MRNCDNFGIRLGVDSADDVRIELPELAQTPALCPIIAEKIADRVPPRGQRDFALSCRYHPCEGRSHLGSERYLTVAAVRKSVRLLVDYLFGGLGSIEFCRLEYRCVVFFVPVLLAHPLHVLKEVTLKKLVLRVKIANTLVAFIAQFSSLHYY